MQTRAVLVSAVAALCAASPAHARQPKETPGVGQAAPPLVCSEVLQHSGDELDLASLRGRVVVLEFWATWCGPCVAAIPHMNELAEAFEGEPVTFIALTSDDRSAVDKFLPQRPIKGIVALDDEGATHDAYGVRGIPQTFLIDREGRIAAITHPTAVTSRTIQSMLDGRAPALLVPDATAAGETVAVRGEDDVYAMVIRPYTGDLPSWSEGEGSLHAAGQPLDIILANLYGLPRTRIIDADALLPGDLIEIRAKVPAHAAGRLSSAIRGALEVAFDVEIRLVERELDAFVMTVPTGPGPSLEPTQEEAAGIGSAHRLLVSEAATLASLASMLEPYVGRPIVNRADDDRRFSFSLRWSADTAESVIEAAEDQLGVRLSPARKEVPVIVVGPAPSPDERHD